MKDLRVNLDRLVYVHKPNKFGIEAENVFIYFITISNLSQTIITLCGRRWVIEYENGNREIIDGQGIVGKEPTLATGESFSYNSYHASSMNCFARGSYHGIESSGAAIYARIPEFQMRVPSNPEDSSFNNIDLI